MVAAADAGKVRVAYIAESAWGATPTTPTFQSLRRTGGNIRTNKTTQPSAEVNLDRNVREIMQLGQDAVANYEGELSYATLDPLFAGALQGAWATNSLTVGATRSPFTIEETVDIGGGSFTYHRMVGSEVDRLSLDIAARQPVTYSLSLMGKSEAADTAIISGATYTAGNTKGIMTALNFAGLTLAGLSPLPKIRRINLQISNGLRVNPTVGDLYTDELGSGDCVITGTIEALFKSNALYQKVLDHASGQLQFTIGGVTNEKYTFNMPAIRFLDGARDLGGGKGGPVLVSVPFQAEGNSSTPSLTLTRAVV